MEPVLQVITESLQGFGAILGPLMEQLRPAIEAVCQVLRTLADGLITAFAAMVPLIVQVADFLAFLAKGIEAMSRPLIALSMVMSTLWSAIADFITAMFGDSAKSGMDAFKDAMVGLARILVGIAAKIAMAFGALTFLDKLEAAFSKKTVDPKDIKGTKAAMNPAFMDFQSFGNAVAKNASIATGGDQKKKPEDWLSIIAEDIKKIKVGEDSFIDTLAAKIGSAVATAIKGGAYETVRNAARSPLGFVANPLVYGIEKAFGD